VRYPSPFRFALIETISAPSSSTCFWRSAGVPLCCPRSLLASCHGNDQFDHFLQDSFSIRMPQPASLLIPRWGNSSLSRCPHQSLSPVPGSFEYDCLIRGRLKRSFAHVFIPLIQNEAVPKRHSSQPGFQVTFQVQFRFHGLVWRTQETPIEIFPGSSPWITSKEVDQTSPLLYNPADLSHRPLLCVSHPAQALTPQST